MIIIIAPMSNGDSPMIAWMNYVEQELLNGLSVCDLKGQHVRLRCANLGFVGVDFYDCELTFVFRSSNSHCAHITWRLTNDSMDEFYGA